MVLRTERTGDDSGNGKHHGGDGRNRKNREAQIGKPASRSVSTRDEEAHNDRQEDPRRQKSIPRGQGKPPLASGAQQKLAPHHERDDSLAGWRSIDPDEECKETTTHLGQRDLVDDAASHRVDELHVHQHPPPALAQLHQRPGVLLLPRTQEDRKAGRVTRGGKKILVRTCLWDAYERSTRPRARAASKRQAAGLKGGTRLHARAFSPAA